MGSSLWDKRNLQKKVKLIVTNYLRATGRSPVLHLFFKHTQNMMLCLSMQTKVYLENCTICVSSWYHGCYGRIGWQLWCHPMTRQICSSYRKTLVTSSVMHGSNWSVVCLTIATAHSLTSLVSPSLSHSLLEALLVQGEDKCRISHDS